MPPEPDLDDHLADPLAARGYWMNETSGVLAPAVEAYLMGHPLAPEHVAAIRAYLRQWIAAPDWRGPLIGELRLSVEGIDSRAAITRWLDLADEAGIDPL